MESIRGRISRALATIKGYYDYATFQPIQIAGISALRHCEDAVERQALERPKGTSARVGEVPEGVACANGLNRLLNEAARRGGGGGQPRLRRSLAMVENEHRLRQAVRQIGRCLR